MKKALLVSGSLAYDHLYRFPGLFQNVLSTNARFLSSAFNVIDKAIHYGGCAGNVAYNSRLLNEEVIVVGIAGKDFASYEEWLHENSIKTSSIIKDPKEYTSQAIVTTDKKGQQITFFHEGAARLSIYYKNVIKKNIKKIARNAYVALISPNNKNFMLITREACEMNKIPYFFDPGQAVGLFTSSELVTFIKNSFGTIVNESECGLLLKTLKISLSELKKIISLLVITYGEKGSGITFNGTTLKISPIRTKHVVDPTGCGDAYRAGFLIGIKETFPKITSETLKKAGALASRLATACLQNVGTQNHSFTK